MLIFTLRIKIILIGKGEQKQQNKKEKHVIMTQGRKFNSPSSEFSQLCK